MDETMFRKHRLFFSWQDEQQQAWLGEMSRQGLHLKGCGAFGGFLFEKGPARQYSYCLDYNRNKPPDDYLQLIQDAGWEHLGRHAGWHYWRKEIRAGVAPELFTDPESKIQKYQRLLAGYITSAPALFIIGLAMFKKYPGRHPLWFVILYISLFMAWIIFAAINAIMIQMRIHALKQKKIF
jgi:Protein of unknown function (DUF2812)